MNQFTVQAQRALQLSIEAAESLHHNYIGTEHILLGLRREGTALAAKVLAANGIEEEKILDMISRFLSPDSNVTVADRSGYTPSARRVLDAAIQEANRSRSKLVGTEHILISILKEPSSAASRIITTLGGNVQNMYQQILNAIGPRFS